MGEEIHIASIEKEDMAKYRIPMEKSSEDLKLGRVSFQHRLPSHTRGRLEKMDPYRALEHMNKERPSSSSCTHSLEVPKNPHEAMEFLSRSWSPSASDFFQIFSSDSLSSPVHENDNKVEKQRHDNKAEIGGTRRASAQSKKDTIKGVENIWKWLAAGRTLFWVHQKQMTSLKNNWMKMRYMKGWLRGHESLSSFSKGHKSNKKVDGIRLEKAKVHAALSVAQLAAAIAGFAAKSGFELEAMNHEGGTAGPSWNKNQTSRGVVFASAAALLATVCAEAAESAGAHRSHVAAAVNSGLAITASSDMITLTATAATCLRGAATLKSRVKADTYFSKDLEMLANGTLLSMCTPSGGIKLRMFSIYLKHNRLVLRSGRKYLGGFLTRSKDYKIMNVIKETREAPVGFHPMGLLTCVGKIVLLFEDKKQCNTWKSTISHILQNRSSYSHSDAAIRADI